MRKFLVVPLALLGGAHLARAVACADGGEDGACEVQGGDGSAMVQTHRRPAMVQTHKHLSRKLGSGPYSRTTFNNSQPYKPNKEQLGKPETETGKIKIDVDGEIMEYWLPGATTEDDYTSVKYVPPFRFYLMNKYTTNFSNPADFAYLPYIGKTFSVDFNFGGTDGASCGCNLNFYLVNMPVALPGSDGDYYCDAQCFPDMGCCAEFDMNEGNMNTQQMTNHACTNDYDDHPDWVCHKWGDPELKTTQSEFSSGADPTINSAKNYTYQQEFSLVDGQAKVVTRIIQGANVVTKTMGPGSDQLNAMFQVIETGMAFVTGYWFAEDMNWLDGDECGQGPETCNGNPAWLSNWKLTTNGNVPTPSPSPSTTPAPDPNTTPAPSPSPDAKCCWETCGSSCGDGMEGWCSESAANCGGCGGGVWCT